MTARWEFNGPNGVEFVNSAFIESGQTKRFILLYEDPPTPNQEVPNAKRHSDYILISDPSTQTDHKQLTVGHWAISVEVMADNCAPLLLKGGFTITKDHRIVFDKPALRQLTRWL